MSEFFQNIYMWAGQNANDILAALGLGSLAGVVGTIVTVVKSIATTKAASAASNEAKSAAENANKSNNKVLDLSNNINSIVENINDKVNKTFDTVNAKINKLETQLADTMAVVTNKVDTMLEVQSVVYDTIKDENIRSTVKNLLVNAKYTETQTRAALNEEISKLKAQVIEQSEAMKQLVEQTADKLQGAIGETETKDTEVEEIPETLDRA